MKKSIALFLALLLAFSAVPLVSTAENVTAGQFMLSYQNSVIPGESFTVAVIANNAVIKGCGIKAVLNDSFSFVSGKWVKSAFNIPDDDDEIAPILSSNMRSDGTGFIDAAALAYAPEDGEQIINGTIFNLKLTASDDIGLKSFSIEISCNGNDGIVNSYTVPIEIYIGVQEESEEPIVVSEEPVDVSEESTDVSEESTYVSEESTDVSEESTDVSEESTDVSEESTDVSEEPIDVSADPVDDNVVISYGIDTDIFTEGDTVTVTLSATGIIKSFGIQIADLEGFNFVSGKWIKSAFQFDDGDIAPTVSTNMKTDEAGYVDAAALAYAPEDGAQYVDGDIFTLKLTANADLRRYLSLNVSYNTGNGITERVVLVIIDQLDEPDPEPEPDAYLWLKNDGTGSVPVITYYFDTALLNGNYDIDIEALVMFEDCYANGGCAYLNCYPYNDNDMLLNWSDYAKDSTCEDGVWTKVECRDYSLGMYGINPSYATFSIGFWMATGTIKVSYINVYSGGELVWSIDYSNGFVLDENEFSYIQDITAENLNEVWGLVGAEVTIPDPDPDPDPDPEPVSEDTNDDSFYVTFDKSEYKVGDTVTATVYAVDANVKSIGIELHDCDGFEFTSGKWNRASFEFEDGDIAPVLMSNMKSVDGSRPDAAALAYSADNGAQRINGKILTLKVKVCDSEYYGLTLNIACNDGSEHYVLYLLDNITINNNINDDTSTDETSGEESGEEVSTDPLYPVLEGITVVDAVETAAGQTVTINVIAENLLAKSIGVDAEFDDAFTFKSGKWVSSAINVPQPDDPDETVAPILKANMKYEDGIINAAALAYDAQDGAQYINGKLFTLSLTVNPGVTGDHVVYLKISSADDVNTLRSVTLPVVVSVVEHIWVLDSVTPGTCVNQGFEHYVCTHCDLTKDEPIPIDPDNHVHTELRGVLAANCGVNGYTGDLYCSDCNELISQGSVIPASGNHNWVMISETAATCISTGRRRYECSVCHNTRTETIPVDPHNHDGETEIRGAFSETCGADGYTGDVYCLDCGKMISKGSAIPATGAHQYGEWIVLYGSTCVTPGVRKHICSVCKHEEIEYLPLLDPKLSVVLGDGYCLYEMNSVRYVIVKSEHDALPEGVFVRNAATGELGGENDLVSGFVLNVEINDEVKDTAKIVLLADFDEDGEVTSGDAIYLLRYTLFPDKWPLNQSGDIDRDGETTSTDAIYLLRYTLFPDKWPLCYPDGTRQ